MRLSLLAWWSVIMLVLPWDQEKIVVLCLVVFTYILCNTISKSVNSAFEEKKNTTKILIVSAIDIKIELFISLLLEAKMQLNKYSTLVLVLVSKFAFFSFKISNSWSTTGYPYSYKNYIINKLLRSVLINGRRLRLNNYLFFSKVTSSLT